MSWFFDQWVYGVGHPVFEVSKLWDKVGQELTLTVKQVQEYDTLETEFPKTRYFEGKMLIEIEDKLEEIYIKPEKENTYTFKLSSNPQFVNFDFENSWVKEERYEKSPGEWVNQYQESKDLLAKISALGQLRKIANQASDQQEREIVYSAMRSVILSAKTYWRIKMQTLWQLQGLMVQNGELTLDPDTEKMLLAVMAFKISDFKSIYK